MKATVKICIFLLFFFLVHGCEEKRHDTSCYKGKVVSLNAGDGCFNILEIIESINDGDLHNGSTITFDPKLSEKTIKVGDNITFNIVQFEDWVGPATANCLWPQYIAQIELCDK
ncbi:MAG TPA: hypothetical protein VHP38_07650 [Ruminiclostridium sp.]|nr:hypothetical protein [Ruminiclostridium sp.]